MQFSVLMCVYGGDDPEYFRQALQSVYDQTVQPSEIVLVVDGPVPDSINNVIKKFENVFNDFNVIRLKQNCGHGIARQTAFDNCHYNYIAIVDADDISTNDRFEKELKEFEKDPDLGLVSSYCTHFCKSVDEPINIEKTPSEDADIKKAMKTSCPVCQPAAILNKNEVEKAGGYQDWYMAEDYYLWIRMMQNGTRFKNIPQSLLFLRTTPDQMQRRGGYKYYKSMKKLYKYMLKHKIINLPIYLFNTSSRFVVQVLMSGKMRAFVRKILQ